jgi:hypothetical protein
LHVDDCIKRVEPFLSFLRVGVGQLLAELPSRFGVSISSVKTYLSTDAFVIDDGMVSKNESEYVARDPALQAGAFWDGHRWGQRVMLHQRHFEGYSLAVNFDIAFTNGVRPGDDLLVPLDDTTGCNVSVIWQRHNPSRTVFIGRLSEELQKRGCLAGREVVLVPGADGVKLIADPGHPDKSLVHPHAQGTTYSSDGRISELLSVGFENGEMHPPNIGTSDPLMDLLGDQ